MIKVKTIICIIVKKKFNFILDRKLLVKHHLSVSVKRFYILEVIFLLNHYAYF